MTPKELRSKRKDLVIQLRSLASHAATRDLTPEEQGQVDDLTAKVDALDARLKAIESVEADEDPPADPESNSERSSGRNGVPVDYRDLPDTDGKHPYSMLRVFRHIAGKQRLNGLEGEMHAELLKRNQDQAAKGVLIPWGLSTHRKLSQRGERRDLTTTTGTGSIANILGTDLVDLLRNKMLVQKFGAQVLSGMIGGTFALPKQTAAGTAYWVAEGVAPTTTNQTIGQVTFTPKTLGAFTDLSRKFLLQTSIDAEAFVKNDLAAILAIEMDRAGINGSGSGAEPQGILQMGGIGSVALGTNGAVPDFASMVNLESLVAIANADVGSLGYMASVKARGKLKQTLKAANTAGKMIWEDGEVNGYMADASNQVPSTLTKGSGTALSALIFGNWAALVYAMWGALDVIEDPYTKSSTGGLRIVYLQDLDIQSRIAASFAAIVDMITT